MNCQQTLVFSNYLRLPDGRIFKCAVGKAGIVTDKVEGDNGTPCGTLPFRNVLYRSDRLARPATQLPIRAMVEADAWIDQPDHPDYNTHAYLPIAAGVSHERMCREDNLYDVVAILGYNDDPVVPNKGSAIFMHVASENYGGTAGCVALSLSDLLEVLKVIRPGDYLVVQGDS